jgi:tRNA(Ile)-lysidine synthetase-like protein
VEQALYDSLNYDILPQLSLEGGHKILFLIGVSGGCDSVALFHLMMQHQRKVHNDVQHMLHVAHFDHQQRGMNSTLDRELVQNLCAAYEVPLTCYYWNTDAQKETSFSQAIARSWRQTSMRTLLQELLKEQDAEPVTGVILTAHHRDDSQETLLLKCLRGAHISHLQGLRPLMQQQGVYTARPLLNVTKNQILEYLRVNNHTWREDESNESTKYLRNRVRKELVPLLADIMGGSDVLHNKLDRLSRQSREIDDDLTQRAQGYLDNGCLFNNQFVLPDKYEQLTLGHKQAMILWAKQQSDNACPLDYDSLERVFTQLSRYPDKRQWRLNLGGGWDIVRQGGLLKLCRDKQTNEEREIDTVVKNLSWKRATSESGKKENSIEGITITISSDCLECGATFVLASVGSHAKLPFTPSWRKGHRSTYLTEFLRGQKIPLHERCSTPVILLLKQSGEPAVVAVCPTTSNDWIVDASFHPSTSAGENIVLSLN